MHHLTPPSPDLASNFSKANNYVQCEACGKQSCNGCKGEHFEFRLLICRAVLGKAQVMDDKDRTIANPRAGCHSVVAYGKEANEASTFAFSEFVACRVSFGSRDRELGWVAQSETGFLFPRLACQ